MSNPPSSSGTRFIQNSMGVPTVHADAAAVSWLGSQAMTPHRSFPILSQMTFSQRGNGRASLIESVPANSSFPRGPRVGRTAGTIDIWLTTGDAAADIAFLHSVESTGTPPAHTFGVNSSNQFVGSLEDEDGTTVAAWTADTFDAVVADRTLHVQVSWNSQTAIDGLYYVKVFVNGRQMSAADFTTPPTASWTGFAPMYLSTGSMADADFNGTMLLTQLASNSVL